MVSVNVPLRARFLVATVSVDVPEDAIDVGANVAVARFGTPLTDRLTVPENPWTAPIVTVNVVVPPRLMVRLAGAADIVKSPLVTTRVTVLE